MTCIAAYCNSNRTSNFGTFAGTPLTYCRDHEYIHKDFTERLKSANEAMAKIRSDRAEYGRT